MLETINQHSQDLSVNSEINIHKIQEIQKSTFTRFWKSESKFQKSLEKKFKVQKIRTSYKFCWWLGSVVMLLVVVVTGGHWW